MGQGGGRVRNLDDECLQLQRRSEVEEWDDERAVVLRQDLSEVALDGGAEVAMGGGGDNEIGRE